MWWENSKQDQFLGLVYLILNTRYIIKTLVTLIILLVWLLLRNFGCLAIPSNIMKPELLEVSLAYTVDWSQLLVASELLFTQTKLSLR